MLDILKFLFRRDQTVVCEYKARCPYFVPDGKRCTADEDKSYCKNYLDFMYNAQTIKCEEDN